jgi:hypothetical protein
MAKRTQSRKNAAAPRADGRLIAIRAQDDGKLIEKFVIVTSAPTIVRMAAQWGYGLKSADAAVVDAASEIPWEYLLSAATQSLGRFESLLVTRCLSNNSMVAPTKPKNVLFVESSPGRIEYDFDDEEKRLRAAVKLEENAKSGKGDGLTFSKTDPITKLRGLLGKQAWDVVHITGVDTHQAAWLVEDFYATLAERNTKVVHSTSAGKSSDVVDSTPAEKTSKVVGSTPAERISKVINSTPAERISRVIDGNRLQDGMILRGDSYSEFPVRYDELADFVLESKKPPGVVSLNLYYSGARTARELVKQGVYAALGFLDEINDEFAELFFQALVPRQ